MIKFFRKIRQRLLSESKFSKYLIYALGEILLVMIGILLALQVNTWNEERKDHKKEVQLYENLIESLQADSVDLVRVRGLVYQGLSAQRFFISTSFEKLITDHSVQMLRDSIEMTALVGNSFFPRFSAYGEVTNNGYLALIKSEDIKSKLAELYDRKYARYLHIDASIDKKSELHFEPIIRADLQILFEISEVQSSVAFDLELFKKHYPAFIRECTSIFTTSLYAMDALWHSHEAVNDLLSLLREELKHSES